MVSVCPRSLPSTAAFKDFGEDNQDVAKMRCKYGARLTGLAKYKEARVQLPAALPLIERSLGRKDNWSQRTIRELVRLYEAWGKDPEARRFKALLEQGSESPR
jgi:hypothetical protein